MLNEEYAIPPKEFIIWALSNKEWKLIKVVHCKKPIYSKRSSSYYWMTTSGRLVVLHMNAKEDGTEVWKLTTDQESPSVAVSGKAGAYLSTDFR